MWLIIPPKNCSSQHSRKMPCLWQVGLKGLTLSLTVLCIQENARSPKLENKQSAVKTIHKTTLTSIV